MRQKEGIKKEGGDNNKSDSERKGTHRIFITLVLRLLRANLSEVY